MKRILSAVLVLIAVFSLTACGLLNKEVKVPELTPANGNTQGGEPSKDDGKLAELFQDLAGVWVYKHVDGQGYFITFNINEDDEYIYTSGMMFTDGMRGGAAKKAVEVREGVYELTVDYPEVEASELNDGAKAETKTYTLDISYLDDGIVIIDDAYVDGPRDYNYAGSTMNEANDNFFSENDGKEYTLDGLWAQLYGVWVSGDGDGTLSFIWFDDADGTRTYTSGIMFSGAVESGEIVSLNHVSDATVALTVSYAAVPANEMDDGHEAFVKTYTMDLAKADTGYFTIDDMFVPSAQEYSYCAPNLERANEMVLS